MRSCLITKLVSRPFKAVYVGSRRLSFKLIGKHSHGGAVTGKYRPASIDKTYNHEQILQLQKTHKRQK